MKMESGLIKQPISIIKNVLILSLPLYFLFYGFLFLEEKRLLRKDFQIKIKEEDEGVIQKKRIGDIWDFPSAIMGVIPTQTPRFYLNNKQIVVTIDLYSQFKEGEKIKLEYAKYSEIVFNIVKI
ncbi:MAG: hypothetical protein HZC05_04130 [Candidatus Magasanikbacteria bacterium]|nr:hypothetical protein [Candidatus Magasanikbacteria bacterium]